MMLLLSGKTGGKSSSIIKGWHKEIMIHKQKSYSQNSLHKEFLINMQNYLKM